MNRHSNVLVHKYQIIGEVSSTRVVHWKPRRIRQNYWVTVIRGNWCSHNHQETRAHVHNDNKAIVLKISRVDFLLLLVLQSEYWVFVEVLEIRLKDFVALEEVINLSQHPKFSKGDVQVVKVPGDEEIDDHC